MHTSRGSLSSREKDRERKKVLPVAQVIFMMLEIQDFLFTKTSIKIRNAKTTLLVFTIYIFTLKVAATEGSATHNYACNKDSDCGSNAFCQYQNNPESSSWGDCTCWKGYEYTSGDQSNCYPEKPKPKEQSKNYDALYIISAICVMAFVAVSCLFQWVCHWQCNSRSPNQELFYQVSDNPSSGPVFTSDALLDSPITESYTPSPYFFGPSLDQHSTQRHEMDVFSSASFLPHSRGNSQQNGATANWEFPPPSYDDAMRYSKTNL